MCGISGIINRSFKPIEKKEIQKINDLIQHRGPDDEGFYIDKNFAFGHRRLSILDLSKDGHQPMHYLDKYTITYNGEVYNYLEIKEELLKDGYIFHSHTDTEVILASYDKWGEECVKRFNGMWAFAIYDKQKDIIFCSRDRFGIKPFYYTEINGKFVFGSEIKQLIAFYNEVYVNKKILMDYLIIGYEDHTNETFFENIYKLEQSNNLIYDLKTNNFSIKKYYKLKKNPILLNENDSVERYRKQLAESINIRLRSDVKVGTCLSGGLDSSSIATIASKKYFEQSKSLFTAIHAKSTQHETDESFFAKEVSAYCNLDLNIVEPSAQEFIDIIDEVIYTQEEPFGSPSIYMQYFVMKKAKELNCTVMLDGQGGDETLLGYERYYPAYLKNLRFIEFVKEFINSSKNSKLTKKQLIQYFIYFSSAKIRLRNLRQKNKFIKDRYFSKISNEILEKNVKCFLNIFELQNMEIFSTQMPHLLRYEDKNSMRHSIETRLPFIDFKVLETAINTSNKYKIKDGWTKYILRKVVNGILPENVVWRKNKFGFEAPTKTWIDCIDQNIQSAITNSTIIVTITNKFELNKLSEKQKWRLFNIAKWEQIYNVKIN